MPESRPKNFIERLPEIIDREEADISHLDDEMVAILYPDRADKTFHLTVVFGAPGVDDTSERSERYDRAVAVASKSPRYRSEGEGRNVRHFASFGIDEVNELHELFYLVSEFPSCEVLVRGKRVPYGRELWLPMFWYFKKEPVEV